MSGTVTGNHAAELLARLSSGLKTVFAPPIRRTRSAAVPAGSPVNRRHQDALAVLTAARGVIRRGWVQHTWYMVKTPAGRRRRAFQLILPSRIDHTQVVQACLVGAVMHAAWQQSPRPEHAYPAIDALWHTLLDSGNTPGPDPVGPVCSPPVRAGRVRDLTTWNDRHHRTKEEVLELLDRAAAHIADADNRTDVPQ